MKTSADRSGSGSDEFGRGVVRAGRGEVNEMLCERCGWSVSERAKSGGVRIVNGAPSGAAWAPGVALH
jgi:hypothetical protein